MKKPAKTAKKNYPPRKGNKFEFTYVEWDEDAAAHCVFGKDSGFAYASFSDKGEADTHSKDHNQNTRDAIQHVTETSLFPR